MEVNIKKHCQAVILAAGESTRTYPLTLTRPKSLLRIAGKTIIEHNLEQLDGIADEVFLVVGYKEEMMKKYLGNKFRNIKINYLQQDQRLGTAHALGIAEKEIEGGFILMAGDDLYSKQDIIKCLKHKNCVLAQKKKDISRFGVLLAEGRKVKKIIEKPKNFVSDLANTGLYVFSKEIFSALKKIKKSERHEYELTDAIGILAENQEINYEEVKSYWLPIGYPWNIIEANEFMLSLAEKKIEKGARIEKGAMLKGEIMVGRGTFIKSGVYIEGPVKIGKNCLIGPNCYIRSSTTIGDSCHIGHAVEIKNSIIGDNTNVAHLSYIGDSIIGDNCNIGAGTITANLRHDWKNIKCMIRNELKDTGRVKLGIVMGDNCKTGINTSFFPGVKIDPECITFPGDIVKRDLIKNKL
ncbi:MAG: bifunctional sugar-1-phosphate nucleotidylyltransferase/acetyltransferase [Patescibacteria group bacterium]